MRTLLAIALLLFSFQSFAEKTPLSIRECKMLFKSLNKLAAVSGKDPVIAESAKRLNSLLTSPSKNRADIEKEVIVILTALYNQGKLHNTLAVLIVEARNAGLLKQFPPGGDLALVERANTMIEAEIISRGLALKNPSMKFRDWSEIANEQTQRLKLDKSTSVKDPLFKTELEKLTGFKFQERNKIEVLADGIESFKKRDQLIDQAKSSIDIMTWGFYGDYTGMLYAKKLIDKATLNPEIKIRIYVDFLTSQNTGYHESLDHMQKSGKIEIVYYKSAENPFYGNHRKAMIVDGEHAIIGGRNFGDAYSNLGPDGSQKWRDTDVYIQGETAIETQLLFDKLWHKETKPIKSTVTEMNQLMLVSHQPNVAGTDPIYLATLKAFDNAKTSIDIENAYFISTPAMKNSILAALKRGVKVRIFTNSAKSVDEPIVSVPILSSLPELIESGAEVWLKNGDTLHSKFLIVDDHFSWVGSYNLHPRSLQYEGEIVVIGLDAEHALNLKSTFEKDLEIATKIEKADDIKLPKSFLSEIALKYFFNQL